MSSLNRKRVVITRPLKKAASLVNLLNEHGAFPILLPVIETKNVSHSVALNNALRNLALYEWLILTSAEGVEAVWERIEALGIVSLPEELKIAVIGPKTAAALAEKHREPDFAPKEFVAEAIIPGLGNLIGKKVLLARANIARTVLPRLIRMRGGEVDDLVVYHTLPADPSPSSLTELQAGVDMISFTSPSTVEYFARIARNLGLELVALPGNPTFAYIGPITAAKAKSLGMSLDVVAKEYTAEGLVEAILSHYEQKAMTRL